MIRITSNAKDVIQALRQSIGAISFFANEQEVMLDAITKKNIQRNHGGLAWGRTIRDANGENVRWTQSRYNWVKRVRSSRGLGPIFPLLHFTGKLQNELMRGGTGTARRLGGGAAKYSYSPSNDPLVRVHEGWVQPGGSRSSLYSLNKAGQKQVEIPPRPSIFWNEMAGKEVNGLLLKHVDRKIMEAKARYNV